MILHQPDWCRPHGFYLDPALIPPDDDIQDAVCAVRAAVANAHLDLFDDAALTTPATSTAGTALPLERSRQGLSRTSAGAEGAPRARPRPPADPEARPHSMWSDARL